MNTCISIHIDTHVYMRCTYVHTFQLMGWKYLGWFGFPPFIAKSGRAAQHELLSITYGNVSDVTDIRIGSTYLSKLFSRKMVLPSFFFFCLDGYMVCKFGCMWECPTTCGNRVLDTPRVPDFVELGWGRESAFLTSSQAVLVLLVLGPRLRITDLAHWTH